MRNNTRARAIFVAVVGAVIAMGTPTQAEAQGAVINGKVTSEFGANIEGANVYISDLSVSILTNAEGNYTISLPAARVNGQLANLRVRAVGYQPQVRPVRITAGTQTCDVEAQDSDPGCCERQCRGEAEQHAQHHGPFEESDGRRGQEGLGAVGEDACGSAVAEDRPTDEHRTCEQGHVHVTALIALAAVIFT